MRQTALVCRQKQLPPTDPTAAQARSCHLPPPQSVHQMSPLSDPKSCAIKSFGRQSVPSPLVERKGLQLFLMCCLRRCWMGDLPCGQSRRESPPQMTPGRLPRLLSFAVAQQTTSGGWCPYPGRRGHSSSENPTSLASLRLLLTSRPHRWIRLRCIALAPCQQFASCSLKKRRACKDLL